MIPRKANNLFPEVASEEGVSIEAVSDIVNFYWKEIKKELNEPSHISIRTPLGTFEARKKQVLYLVDKYKRIVKHMKPTTYSRHTLLNLTTKKIEMLEKLLDMCEKQELKKKQIREIQKNGKIV